MVREHIVCLQHFVSEAWKKLDLGRAREWIFAFDLNAKKYAHSYETRERAKRGLLTSEKVCVQAIG